MAVLAAVGPSARAQAATNGSDISQGEGLLAAGTDIVLVEAVTEKNEGIAGRNYAKDIKGEEMARVRVGNEWSETALARGTGIAANLADSVEAKGTSAVHIGNQYGGRGIFDEGIS
ncbi:Het-s 218-289-domain-containing protein [Dactylonectria macrodidyma]|uniref:Het-s 218-289-domain-containing protein n=1 Tax=Dactylonectria macrodidyma TaxID=307937 RepID=A0A9P9D4N1_9HYPO|nr:Het-s 218-289-domain-containing protein [Dactylonectria macrodidyma]